MDAQLCKEFIKILPHAGALLIANDSIGYDLVECNQMFDSMFDITKSNASSVVSAIQTSNTPLSQSIISGIHDMMKHGKSEFTKEQSGYNIILNKVSLAENEYLMILILNISAGLQSSIQNYESFYNAIDDMFVVGNQDGTIHFSNESVTKKLGYTQEELKNMHILALHPPEKRKEAEEIFADMFEHKRDVCPLPLLQKNGKYLPVETRVWFGSWDDQERLFAIIRDLTAEQENLQKFAKLFDRNPACMAITSLETGVYTQVNKAFLKTFDYSEEEVIGKTAIELGLIADIEKYNQAKEELLSTGSFNERVMNTRDKSGDIHIGLFSGEIIETQCKKHIMTVMVDITKQAETEQKLARKSELQEILISLSSRYINCTLENIEEEIQNSLELVGHFVGTDRAYIFDYDYQANTTSNTFEFCNTLIEPQIEYLQGVPLSSIPDWVSAHKRGDIILIPDVSALDESVSAVKEILEPQGVKSLVTIPMMFEGKCLGYVGFDAVKEKHIYTDIEIDLLKFYTQILANIHIRKLHEQEMHVARLSAEKANEAKSHFIAQTSHELRNPLNGAWGFLNLLEESLQHEGQRAYLLNSIQSVHSAISILNDLLDISKIESNELKLVDERIDIFSLMNESIVPYKQEMNSKGIQLDIKLDSAIPQNLFGDSSRLKQIIGNLVINAVTHSGSKTIEIVSSLKRQAQDTAELLFFVKDNGIGISKETLDKVFNLFYKKDSSSPGSGLGLSICKEIVSLMGGEIWIESAEDKGSIFYFTMPFRLGHLEHTARKSIGSEGTRNLKGLRILLAEDNAVNQELVIQMLKPKEISVTAVRNGAEVLKALENDQYDLILMDIQMPVMDGVEATKRIRAAQNPIPIIAMTGSVLPQEKESYINSGANGVVEKPIFIDLLLKEICLALNNGTC